MANKKDSKSTTKATETQIQEKTPTSPTEGTTACTEIREAGDTSANTCSNGCSQGVTREEAMSRCVQNNKMGDFEADLEKFLMDHGLIKVDGVNAFPCISAVFRIPTINPAEHHCAGHCEQKAAEDPDESKINSAVAESVEIQKAILNMLYGVNRKLSDIRKNTRVSESTSPEPICGQIVEAQTAELKTVKNRLSKKDRKKLVRDVKKMVKKSLKKSTAKTAVKVDDIVEAYVDDLKTDLIAEFAALHEKIDWIADELGHTSDSVERMADAADSDAGDEAEEADQGKQTDCCAAVASCGIPLPQPNWTIDDWLQFQNHITQYILSSKCKACTKQ